MHLPKVLPPVSDVKLRNRRDQKKQLKVGGPTSNPRQQKPLEAKLMVRQPKRRSSKEVKRLEVKKREERKVSAKRPPSVAISESSEPAEEFEYFNSGFDALYAAAADVSQQGQSQWPQVNRAGLRMKNPKKGVPLPAVPPQSYSHVQVPSYMLGTLGDPYQEDYNQPAGYWITLPQDDV